MPSLLNPERLKRYAAIAGLLWKYGRSDLVREAGMGGGLPEPAAEPGEGKDSTALATELADDLERLGPTYIKLGQLLSTRTDILPVEFAVALTRLQDRCEPFSFGEVEATISADLGVRLSKAFGSFEERPIAAASLGQVHRATLRDGRDVAVKIQRPHVRETIQADLEMLTEMAELIDARTETGKRFQFTRILAEFRKALLRELDYRSEARNLSRLRSNLAAFDRIVVPIPIEDYTSSRVLTMEYIHGQKITSFSPVVMTDLDGGVLAEQLFRAYLKQILVDGFFHADPHPGNVFLTTDDRIALLDVGMVAEVTRPTQDHILRVLVAISEGRAEEVFHAGMRLGEPQPEFDKAEFRKRVLDLVAQSRDLTIEQINVGRFVMAFNRLSADCGIRMPSDLTMVGKALLNLDEIGRTLDPSFDPTESIRRNAADIMRQNMQKSLSPGHLFETFIEAKEFAEKLPRRINGFLDLLAANKLKLRIDALDEGLLIEGLQKVANRITLGLVLAALIVGAALLMRIDTSFRMFGYPGLAMIWFLAASAGGALLVFSILASDRRAAADAKKRTERHKN